MSVISKLCADFLRAHYAHHTPKLKASHAHEIVAAFFGYKSHAALLRDTNYPLSQLEEANILIPDIPLMNLRIDRLNGLPERLPLSVDIASELADFLNHEGIFNGDIWLYETLETYITEVFLIDHESTLMDELSGIMAETNAEFTSYPDYDGVEIEDYDISMVVTIEGVYSGDNLDDKPFSGDTIDFTATIILNRIAGKRGFSEYEISAGGQTRDDWLDPYEEHEEEE